MTNRQDGGIRPDELNNDVIVDLVYRLYGLSVTSYSELDSFWNRNYHVIVDERRDGCQMFAELSSKEYILKIVNSVDSEDDAFAEGTNAIMLHLNANGLTCPQPQPDITGSFYSRETRKDKNNIVSLFNFIPGKVLHDVRQTSWLMYRVGKYVGQMDRVLQSFRHEFYTSRDVTWSIDNVPKLSEYLHLITDLKHQKLLVDVIKAFNEEVIPVHDQLQKGIIHGDAHGGNFLGNDVNGQYDVTAVIDFGDCSSSCLVYEVSILIMFEMIEDTDVHKLDVGGHLLAGFMQEIPLNKTEFDVIKTCVAGRFAQSFVLGQRAILNDPDNSYIAQYIHLDKWLLFKSFWESDKYELYERWRKIISSYTCRNDKPQSEKKSK